MVSMSFRGMRRTGSSVHSRTSLSSHFEKDAAHNADRKDEDEQSTTTRSFSMRSFMSSSSSSWFRSKDAETDSSERRARKERRGSSSIRSMRSLFQEKPQSSAKGRAHVQDGSTNGRLTGEVCGNSIRSRGSLFEPDGSETASIEGDWSPRPVGGGRRERRGSSRRSFSSNSSMRSLNSASSSLHQGGGHNCERRKRRGSSTRPVSSGSLRLLVESSSSSLQQGDREKKPRRGDRRSSSSRSLTSWSSGSSVSSIQIDDNVLSEEMEAFTKKSDAVFSEQDEDRKRGRSDAKIVYTLPAQNSADDNSEIEEELEEDEEILGDFIVALTSSEDQPGHDCDESSSEFSLENLLLLTPPPPLTSAAPKHLVSLENDLCWLLGEEARYRRKQDELQKKLARTEAGGDKKLAKHAMTVSTSLAKLKLKIIQVQARILLELEKLEEDRESLLASYSSFDAGNFAERCDDYDADL